MIISRPSPSLFSPSPLEDHASPELSLLQYGGLVRRMGFSGIWFCSMPSSKPSTIDRWYLGKSTQLVQFGEPFEHKHNETLNRVRAGCLRVSGFCLPVCATEITSIGNNLLHPAITYLRSVGPSTYIFSHLPSSTSLTKRHLCLWCSLPLSQQ